MRKTFLITLLLTTACSVGPDYERPKMDMPDGWSQQQEQSSAQVITLDWWKQFNDPALNNLEEEGLKANDDLLKAAGRVAEARANVASTDSELFPELDAQAGATRTSNSKQAVFSGFPLSSKPYNTFNVAGVLNYEIDLWGKLRRADESARAELLSAKANRDAVKLALAAEIANGYFNLRALDAQMIVTDNTIQSRSEEYDYQKKQYDHGAIDGLTFREAESELAGAKATRPILVQAREEQITALAILLGRSPKQIAENNIETGETIDNLPAPPVLPDNLPSTLLERRPDVQVAEQNLISANAEIGVAKADYFPVISLSALLGLESSKMNNLLRSSARYWDAQSGVSMPVLDFGRTKAEVDTAKAIKKEGLADYQKTVRTAFKDALDAMSAENTTDDRVTAENQQADSRAETLRLANLRYKAGYSNYLEVTDAQRNLYQAQLDRITAKRDRLTASVNLYKALGGGWQSEEKASDNNENHSGFDLGKAFKKAF